MENLADEIRNKNAILFVGAGLSINLGLPSFRQLIDHIAQQLDYDPEIFGLSGDYLTLAEYYCQKKGIGSLRSWMDTTWHTPDVKIETSEIHKIIVELDFPIIYTTNYDRWLEGAYKYYNKDYISIVNVGDIAKIRGNVTQIIKYHGDFSDDSSIVLTESSYFERLNFEAPLDIKLRADILGKTILFLGYSLSDINIRYLIYKLHKLWQSTSCIKERPRSYIFLTKPNPVLQSILESRGITPFISESDIPQVGLTNFLRRIAGLAIGKT